MSKKMISQQEVEEVLALAILNTRSYVRQTYPRFGNHEIIEHVKSEFMSALEKRQGLGISL